MSWPLPPTHLMKGFAFAMINHFSENNNYKDTHFFEKCESVAYILEIFCLWVCIDDR
jgi:hypothetical protein